MTCETVVTETPASRATSAMVTTAREDGKPCWRVVNENHPIGGRAASACAQALAAVASSGVHPVVREVTARISQRSENSRSAYLERVRAASAAGPARGDLGCANLAHGIAACGADEKLHLRAGERRNVAIVSAYNDMLSAHQPLERYPAILKKAVLQAGGVAQFAGGVPAMCDGITQGRAGHGAVALQPRRGRDVDRRRALARHVRRRADARRVRQDRARAADRRAHLRPPADRLRPRRADAVAACPNAEKSRVRQLHATGEVGPEELLDAELASYHSPGTCTFYGTANSNQLVVEAMGLHLPGRVVREPRHAAAPRAHRGGRPRRHAGLRPDRRDRRRARAGQRRRRAAGHRRLDQPHHAPRGRRRRGGAVADLGRLQRPLGGRPAAGPRLPQRPGRHQPLPRGGRRRRS